MIGSSVFESTSKPLAGVCIWAAQCRRDRGPTSCPVVQPCKRWGSGRPSFVMLGTALHCAVPVPGVCKPLCSAVPRTRAAGTACCWGGPRALAHWSVYDSCFGCQRCEPNSFPHLCPEWPQCSQLRTDPVCTDVTSLTHTNTTQHSQDQAWATPHAEDGDGRAKHHGPVSSFAQLHHHHSRNASKNHLYTSVSRSPSSSLRTVQTHLNKQKL